MELKTNISNWVDAHRDEIVADIAALVAIKSVHGAAKPGMPFGEGPAKALDASLALCEKLGFSTRNYDYYVGTADLMPEAETALDILGHLDVVGEGEGWDTDPYTATLRDGFLYGRGTDDDKGPVVAAAYAMRAVKELGLPIRRNVRLIMGTNEETGFEDLDHYYAIEKPAPNTFTPDASFPVYNTEKGSYKPTIRRSWKKETAEPRVSALQGGYRINVVAPEASAMIEGLDAISALVMSASMATKMGVSVSATPEATGIRLHVTGRACHAANPHEGINANTALLKILAELPLADCESTRALRALSACFPHGDNAGTAIGIAQEDEISGRLTMALTMMEADETGLQVRLDSRVPLCATQENCADVLTARLTAEGFTVTGEMDPPHHTPADSPFVQTLLRCYETYTGKPGECRSMGGGTYVHYIEGGVAFGAEMPGFVSNLHGANEHIRVDDLLTACKIFAQVIAELCCDLPEASA